LVVYIFSWSATCVIGSPKVYPKYGDKPGVWAPAVKDNKQFLEVIIHFYLFFVLQHFFFLIPYFKTFYSRKNEYKHQEGRAPFT
jgi:hypothetical protein